MMRRPHPHACCPSAEKHLRVKFIYKTGATRLAVTMDGRSGVAVLFCPWCGISADKIKRPARRPKLYVVR